MIIHRTLFLDILRAAFLACLMVVVIVGVLSVAGPSSATFVGGAAGAIQGAMSGSRLVPGFGRAGSSILTGNAGASAALAGSLTAIGTKSFLDGMCR